MDKRRYGTIPIPRVFASFAYAATASMVMSKIEPVATAMPLARYRGGKEEGLAASAAGRKESGRTIQGKPGHFDHVS
ncbi:hypothetical protein [Phyllobacterium sp. K27]